MLRGGEAGMEVAGVYVCVGGRITGDRQEKGRMRDGDNARGREGAKGIKRDRRSQILCWCKWINSTDVSGAAVPIYTPREFASPHLATTAWRRQKNKEKETDAGARSSACVPPTE